MAKTTLRAVLLVSQIVAYTPAAVIWDTLRMIGLLVWELEDYLIPYRWRNKEMCFHIWMCQFPSIHKLQEDIAKWKEED